MATDPGIHTFMLQELRLRDSADANEAAAIVAASSSGAGPAVPLLTSIDDERDVAVVSAVHAGETPESDVARRKSLDALVATWQPPQRYLPKITERTTTRPSHYRLAVTESGINNAEPTERASIAPMPDGVAQHGAGTPLDLLWVGVPLGTYAGLLILLGNSSEKSTERADARDWPLPLSRYLGVRIYDSRR